MMSLNEIDASPASTMASSDWLTTVAGCSVDLTSLPIVRFIGTVSGWCPILIISGLNWNSTRPSWSSVSLALPGRVAVGRRAGLGGAVGAELGVDGLAFCWTCWVAFVGRL